jgi:hypothetical protein
MPETTNFQILASLKFLDSSGSTKPKQDGDTPSLINSKKTTHEKH